MNLRRANAGPWTLTFLLAACHSVTQGVPASTDAGTRVASAAQAPPVFPSPLSQAELSTTDGKLALSNLDAEIAGIESSLAKNGGVERMALLAENLEARAQYLGKLADYEKAATLAEAAVARAPKDGAAYAMRAKIRAVYHRFADAARDLDQAQALGVPEKTLRGQRASISQALGRYDEALALRHALSAEKQELSTLGNEATVLSEMGRAEQAEQLFVEAQHHFRDVSPFPVAWLWFQQGTMWEKRGKPSRARALFEAAVARVPGYAHAASHLASLSPPERAIAILEPIVQGSDDPEYQAQLGTLLREQGQTARAEQLIADARREYDQLTLKRPEAFADHAARFWLGAGADPAKALLWAKKNAEVRATEAALTLLVDAALAAHDAATACAAGKGVQSLPRPSSELHLLAARAYDACGRSDEANRERGLASAAP